MRITDKIINTILIGTILVCAFILGHRYYQYYHDRKAYDMLNGIKPVSARTAKNPNEDGDFYEPELAPTETPDTYKHEMQNEEKLKELNSDYRFWIYIPGTNIDYPVVQSTDNEEYLHLNFYRESSLSGAIFADYRNDVNTDKNIIIYGHNMKDSTMFTMLNQFKERVKFNKGVVKIIKDNCEYEYEIFSVFLIDGNSDSLRTTFTDEGDFRQYLDYLKSSSLLPAQKDNTSDYKRIITLYTCSYEFDGARTVVCAGMR